MERADYIKLYSAPESYEIPSETDHLDTHHPNLNSKEYRQKTVEKTTKLNSFYESLSVNSKGLTILASNDIKGRIWNGNIWGFENLKDVRETTSCFKLQADSPVTKVKFTEDRIFLVCQMNGSVNVWSTQSEAREASGYCLFMIGEKKEHLGSVLDMDLLLDKTKLATGSNDRSIKVWDTGAADLTCITTLSFAHSDDINSVFSSPSTNDVFATCSRDKSALIWDHRLATPAKALYEKHEVGFSTVYWYNTGQDEYILLGDDSGCIYKVDPKMPRKFLHKLKVFNRPIRKISVKSGMMAVIGHTNTLRIYGNDDRVILNNDLANDLIRDFYWENVDSLYTIGWSREFRHHAIEL